MKNRNIVKQDFKLVNAKYKLNTSEIKFIMNAIAQIDADDDEFTEYEIKVSDLEEKLQMAKNKHTRLKEFAKKIMSKPILIEQDNEDFTVFNWFSRIRYISKQAKFIVKIDDELKPYLLNLKNRFVKYNLKYILPLTSNYSIKIYQLLKEYEKLEKRKFKVEELQDFLQVPKSLKIYNRFKEKVLKVAERELIKHCDIFFEFEEIKAGRKVDEILFRIKENKHIKEKEAIEDINYTKEFSRFKKQKFWLNGEIGTFINTSNENDKIALNFKMNQGNAKAIFETEEGAYNFLSSNRA
jgi:plasmid replication initiation protein